MKQLTFNRVRNLITKELSNVTSLIKKNLFLNSNVKKLAKLVLIRTIHFQSSIAFLTLNIHSLKIVIDPTKLIEFVNF
jgi:hypothetical protein